jgi:microcystin-dependent protein
MANPYVGEIRMFSCNFAPLGWAFCNGQLLSIAQNTALFSLLGTQFGGDGKSNFALPNLQGCFPNNQGQGAGLSDYFIGQTGGSAAVTLLTSEIPAHAHSIACAATGNSTSPSNAVFGGAPRGKAPAYASSTGPKVNMSTAAVAIAGGSQPHSNMPPFLVLNFCIALQGVYPPRS